MTINRSLDQPTDEQGFSRSRIVLQHCKSKRIIVLQHCKSKNMIVLQHCKSEKIILLQQCKSKRRDLTLFWRLDLCSPPSTVHPHCLAPVCLYLFQVILEKTISPPSTLRIRMAISRKRKELSETQCCEITGKKF